MKTDVLIGSAALWKDCLFLATGYGKKETEGMIFSKDFGNEGEWVCFDKGIRINFLSKDVLPLETDKIVNVYLDGIFQGKAILPTGNSNTGSIEITLLVQAFSFINEPQLIAV